MTSRKKQEENHLKILKDLLSQPANKKCLECDQRGPTYVDVTIGSFVCTSCGGLLRGLNPPHRVKSISMTTFTVAEISFIESRGNEWCRAVYLAKYDEQSRAKPESRNDHTKLKHYLELKYEQKRWYESPSQQRKLMESAAAAAKKNQDNSAPPSVKPLNTLLGNNINNVQIPSAKLEISKGIAESKINRPSADLLSSLRPPSLTSPVSGGFGIAKPQETSVSNSTSFSDGFADFDKAFGSFTSAAAPPSQPAFAGFGQISTEPIAFTNNIGGSSAANNTQSFAQPAKPSVDKYAALMDLDLFKTEPKIESNDFMWSSSPAKPAYSAVQNNQIQQSQSVFGMSSSPQASNLFNSTPMPNMNPSPAISSTSWMTAPAPAPAPAQATWSSSSTNWTPSATSWQPTYQQPATNHASPVGNPFFTPATTQQQTNLFGQVNSTGNEYGPWTQPTGAPPAGAYGTNAGMMSSTNPFAMTSAPAPSNPMYGQQQPQMQNFQQPQMQNFQQSQMQNFQQPMMNKPSNPFMF